MKTKKLILVLGIMLFALSCTTENDFVDSLIEEEQDRKVDQGPIIGGVICDAVYKEVTIIYEGGSADLNTRREQIRIIRNNERNNNIATWKKPCPTFKIPFWITFPDGTVLNDIIYDLTTDTYSETWLLRNYLGKPEGSSLKIQVEDEPD